MIILGASNELITIPGRPGQVSMTDFTNQLINSMGGIPIDTFSPIFPISKMMRNLGSSSYMSSLLSGNWGPGVSNNLVTGSMTNLAVENSKMAGNWAMFNKAVDVGAVSIDDSGSFGGGIGSNIIGSFDTYFRKPLGNIVKIKGGMSEEEVREMITDKVMEVVLKALSKIPVYGQIIAAVVGIAYGAAKLAKVIKASRKEKQLAEEMNEFAKLGSFPEDDDFDGYLMSQVLRPTIKSLDWTPLWMPRYNPNSDWIGIPSKDGFAYAPGSGKEFHAMPGMGMIPGTQQITDMLLVYNPNGSETQDFKDFGNNFYSKKAKPKYGVDAGRGLDLGWMNVRDYGDFFPSCAQTLSLLWGHMQLDNNPDIYKVNTREIDKAWKDYCGNGLELARSECTWDVYNKFGVENFMARVGSRLSCAIPCAIGAWRCETWFKELSDGSKQVMRGFDGRVFSGGVSEGGMRKGINYDPDGGSGCVMNFNNSSSDCWGDMYNEYIKYVTAKIRKIQWNGLRHSLVCAYADINSAAFRDPELKSEMVKMRKLLLTRKDQWKYISKKDVSRNDGFYNELRSAGAFAMSYQHGSFDITDSKGSLIPKDPKSPSVEMVFLSGRIPGQEMGGFPNDLNPGVTDGKSGSKSSAAPLLIAAAAALMFLKGRK